MGRAGLREHRSLGQCGEATGRRRMVDSRINARHCRVTYRSGSRSAPKSAGLGSPTRTGMRIQELREGAGALEENEGEVVASADYGDEVRLRAKRALVSACARALFYPTLLYNVVRNRFEAEFRWWDRVDEYVMLGAVPFPSDVLCLKELGVKGVVTLNEPYETLVPTSLYQAHGVNHLEIPTRDYLFAPSPEDIYRAVDFIHRNEMQGGSTYVHCKAGRGRSTTIVLCFLIMYRNMTPEAALDHVRSVRPRVLLAPSQWQAVKSFSTLTARHLSLQSSSQTCSVQSGEKSGEMSSTQTTRYHSFPIQRSNEECLVISGEESSEASITDPEVDSYKFDTEHFVLPHCQSMLSRLTSLTRCSDSRLTSSTRCSDVVFITEKDLKGYETYDAAVADFISVESGQPQAHHHEAIKLSWLPNFPSSTFFTTFFRCKGCG